MQTVRRFVPEGTDPYSLFKYEPHQCLIKHHNTGKVLCDLTVEMPTTWSSNAKDIFISKYVRQKGVPKNLHLREEEGIPFWLLPSYPPVDAENIFGGETSIKQAVHRVVGHWTYIGFKNNYFDPSKNEVNESIDNNEMKRDYSLIFNAKREKNAKAFYDENVYIILNQMASPNSPQWFNTGLWWAYGITGKSQGQYKVQFPDEYSRATALDRCLGPIDEYKKKIREYVKETPDPYSNVQVSACFILGLSDHLFARETNDGILQWYQREGLIFKYGSGSGLNVSSLRAENEPLGGGGRSSGLMSWMKVADYNAGAIKSGGTTRRAACMRVLNLDHPDVLKFIDCKSDSEMAVAALVTGSKHITKHCQTLMDAVHRLGDEYTVDRAYENEEIASLVQQALIDEVPSNTVDKAIRLAFYGQKQWLGEEYGTEFEDEAYTIAPYQNANHSLSIPTRFYDLCDSGGQWDTTFRTNGQIAWSMPAREMEDLMAMHTWISGDPGAQFYDNINDWNVTPEDGDITSSNPCSEHLRLPDSACNLASLNIIKFINISNDNPLNVDDFIHVASMWQMILDISIEMCHLPSPELAIGVFNYRDTGLGYANLGAAVMSLGFAYDSDQGRAFAGLITGLLHSSALLTSAKMAEQLGSYPRFCKNKNAHITCIDRHIGLATGQRAEVKNSPTPFDPKPLAERFGMHAVDMGMRIVSQLGQALMTAKTTGMRNAECTVIAPTGTISLAMDCETSGCEPMLGLVVYKLLAGGGTMLIQPAKCIPDALRSLKYSEDVILSVVKGISDIKVAPGIVPDKEAQKIIRAKIKPEHHSVFDTALSANASITVEGHIKMMAAIQSFVSGAISKTVNMPNSATVQDIKNAYRMAHDMGVKCVAIFRDKCKLSQPLNLEAIVDKISARDVRPMTPEEVNRVSPTIDPKSRMKMNWNRRTGVNLCVSLGTGNLYLMTSHYDDGKVGEIWGTYTADQGLIQALLSHVCKTANVALQFGVPLESIVRTWQDSVFEPNGFVYNHPYIKQTTSMLNLIARLLDYHVLGNTGLLNVQPQGTDVARLAPPVTIHTQFAPTDGSNPPIVTGEQRVNLTGKTCPSCGGGLVVPSGANCEKCLRCGYSGGCG